MRIWNEEIKRLSDRVLPWFEHGKLHDDAPEDIKKDWERLKIENSKEREKQERLCFNVKEVKYLSYSNLLERALEEVPNFKEKYEQLIADDTLDEESGNHIVFGYAFTPVLVEALKNNDNEVVKTMFAFLEKMASSPNVHVVEVCDQSVLEALNDDFGEDELMKYMGKNTIKGYKALKTFME